MCIVAIELINYFCILKPVVYCVVTLANNRVLNDRESKKGEKLYTEEGYLKQRIINSTESAHFCYIMHELHYHKHANLYPLAYSFFLLCQRKKEREVDIGFLQRVNSIGYTLKKQLSTVSQDCSQRLNFVCSTVKGTLYFLTHSVAVCVQQSIQL